MNKLESLFTDKMLWFLLLLEAFSIAFLLYTVSQMKTEPNKHSDRVGGVRLILTPSSHTTVRTVRYTAVRQT